MSKTYSNLFLALTQFTGKALKRMDANLSVHGISYNEYRVLHSLSCAPGLTMPRIELARCIGLSASGVTRMIAPMEKIGLVHKESHPRDARMSLVKLSESGKTIHEEAATTAASVASDFLDILTKSQRDALTQLFSNLD